MRDGHTAAERGSATIFSDFKRTEDGLVPAIVQDEASREVLMLAWMDAAAFERTVATGQSWFFSRSRQELWHKGEESGNVQDVVELRYDCDRDAILLLVRPHGPACHTGETSCFYRSFEGGVIGKEGTTADAGRTLRALDAAKPTPESRSDIGAVLDGLAHVIHGRRGADPGTSYTAKLLSGKDDSLLKKIGEEATEVALAAKANDQGQLCYESADLLYHLLVTCERYGVSLQAVAQELSRRSTQSA